MTIRKEVQIGASLVLAALILYLGQRFFRDLPLFGGQDTYSTIADDAAGVAVGNQVRLSGVYVGNVSDLRIVDQQVRIYFTVSNDIRLPHGTTVVVGGFSFIGDMRLDLVMGPVDTTFHAPGDIIPRNTDEGLLASLSASGPELLLQLENRPYQF